jgi:hypothetical protein
MAQPFRVTCRLLATLATFPFLAATCFAEDFPQPFNTQELTQQLLTPEESLARISLPEGFHVSVFASEPDVNAQGPDRHPGRHRQ